MNIETTGTHNISMKLQEKYAIEYKNANRATAGNSQHRADEWSKKPKRIHTHASLQHRGKNAKT